MTNTSLKFMLKKNMFKQQKKAAGGLRPVDMGWAYQY